MATLVSQWSGISYSVQAQRELHAAVLDTGAADGDELWVLQLGQLEDHRVDKLIRGRIPRARPSRVIDAQLEALDFRQGTANPRATQLELDTDNLFHWGQASGTDTAPETWEASQSFPRGGTPAAALLQAPWTLSVASLDGAASREFSLTVGAQGQVDATVGSCTLKGSLRALPDSDWFDMDFQLTGCGTAHEATALRGFGKLLRPPGRLRFVGAVLGPGGRAGLSVSALPAPR